MKNFLFSIVREGTMTVRWVAVLVAYLTGLWYWPEALVVIKDSNLMAIKVATATLGSWAATVEVAVRDSGVEIWLQFYELWLIVGVAWWFIRLVARRLVRPTASKSSAVVPTRVPSPI